MSTERLDDLEIKMAFQEDLVEALNLTVVRQQQQIDLLQEQLRYLNQQIRELRPGLEPVSDPAAEIPPHY